MSSQSTIVSSWFDAFRDNGGPVLYSSMNRTPAIEDIRNILIYISFTTFFVAFLIIFPGIRKERCSTFICVSTSLFIGAVILISNCGSNWHVAKGSIAGPYRAFSKEKIYANVGVHIGLESVNITLKALPIHQRYEDINYNERFYWIGANQMKHEFQRALAKGLPYPILTISEYLSQDGEGFNWGRHYRIAGYYTSIVLWLAFASWILMNILLCAVPRYGAYTMQLTGALMLLANLIYVTMIPSKPLRIPFEGSTLVFSYGACFWLVFSAGITAVFVGATVSIVDIMFPNKFSTILEVDYDTPYRYFVGNDIHIIGSLPPPLNAYYYHHQHQSSLSTASHQSSSHHLYQKKKSSTLRHYSAAKTASGTTDNSWSCCAGSTTQLTHRTAAKTKSDASTCTRDDSMLPIMQPETNNDDNNNNNKQILIAQVDVEPNNNNGIVSNYSSDSVQRTNIQQFDNTKPFAFENQAYQADEEAEQTKFNDNNNNNTIIDEQQNDDDNNDGKVIFTLVDHTTSANKNDDNNNQAQLLNLSTPLVRTNSSASSLPLSSVEDGNDDDDDEDDESDVSTTIIDGKRAISLSNFGKYAEQREKREGIGHRPMGPTFGHPMASAGFRAINNGFTKRLQQQKQQQKVRNSSQKKDNQKQQSKTHLIGDSSSNNLIGNTSSSSLSSSSTSSGGPNQQQSFLTKQQNNNIATTNLSSSTTTTTTGSTSVRVDLSSSAAMW